jgi:hypothetical protein
MENQMSRRQIEFHNLDLMIAVGDRTKFPRGIQLRQWVTARLSECPGKGFNMDDELLN